VAYRTVARQRPRNETTAVAVQRRGEHVPVASQLQQLDYNKETGVFSIWYVLRSYLGNWSEPNSYRPFKCLPFLSVK
jgi:hypothetical protein